MPATHLQPTKADEETHLLGTHVADRPQQPQRSHLIGVRHGDQRGKVGELRACDELAEQGVAVGPGRLEDSLQIGDRAAEQAERDDLPP